MKHLLSLLTCVLTLCLLAVSDCFAQTAVDEGILHVYTKTNNEATLYDLDDLNKITFSGQGVQLWNTSWPTEYSYANVTVITFRERGMPRPTTGINLMSNGDEGIRIGYNASNGVITVAGNESLERLSVYNSLGVAVYSDTSPKQVYNFSLKQLPQGVYIVKAFGRNGVSTKKIVK